MFKKLNSLKAVALDLKSANVIFFFYQNIPKIKKSGSISNEIYCKNNSANNVALILRVTDIPMVSTKNVHTRHTGCLYIAARSRSEILCMNQISLKCENDYLFKKVLLKMH